MHSPKWRSIVLFAVAALLVVATVPYFVPMRPTVSDSYIFGYNNRAGVLLFVILAAAGAWWTRSKRLREDASVEEMPRWILWASIGIAVAICCAVWRCFTSATGFAESVYFIQRINLLAQGRVPYRDFEFAYGAGVLYVPLWISRIFHLGLANAYYLFWTFCIAAGVFMLFESLRLAGSDRQDRRGIFLIVFILTLFGVLTTGLNYAALRYVLAVYAATLVYRSRQRESQRWTSSGVALAMVIVLLLLSPEIAVAYAMASLLYFAINVARGERRAGFALGAFGCAAAAVFVYANSLGVFSTMRAFSEGGNNFPIYVAPTIAIFFAAVWFGFQYFLQRFQQIDRENVLLYWIALATMLIPAALGRGELGHIFLNALGLFLAVGLVLSGSLRGRWWIRVASSAYILLVLIPALRVEYIPITARAAVRAKSGPLHRYAVLVLGEPTVQALQEKEAAPEFDAPGEKLLAPFSFAPDGFGAYVSPEVEYGYYEALTNVLTPAQVNAKIEEMRSNPETMLLLPRQWITYCLRTADNSRVLLSGLYGVPYIKQPAHEMDLYLPVCEYIRTNYRQVPARAEQNLGDYDLWAPRRVASKVQQPHSDMK